METNVLLAGRSVPEVAGGLDPNSWFSQIARHLRRSPRQRLERWMSFADGELWFLNQRAGMPHVRFDPLEVFRALTERQVLFVVVGMGAGYLQGAPYPSYNLDFTPRMDPANLARMEEVLGLLKACPLKRDEWGPVAEHSLPGYRRLMTSAGMVNVVDSLPGVGSYQRVMVSADLLAVADGLSVQVASLEDVICSKETIRDMPERPRHNRTMDRLHVLMGRETLAAKRPLYGPS